MLACRAGRSGRKTSGRQTSPCVCSILYSFDLGTMQLLAVKKIRQEGVRGRKAGLASDPWAVSRDLQAIPPPSPHLCSGLHLRVRMRAAQSEARVRAHRRPPSLPHLGGSRAQGFTGKGNMTHDLMNHTPYLFTAISLCLEFPKLFSFALKVT